MADGPFLIAGGGIAGLAAALGLARIGRESRLFEQAATFEEVGAGLQMSPNAVRALKWLGAWDAVEPHCVIPGEIHVRNAISGRLLQRMRLGKPFEERFGAPYRVAHRADLLNGLLATAKTQARIALANAMRVTSFVEAPDGVTVEFEGGARRPGAALICADGIRSALRRHICGDVAPVFRGHTLFRGLLPFSLVPPSIAADCVTLWLYPGGHVVHYPVSNWNAFNIVAALDAKADDSGWGEATDNEELRQGFERACDPLQDLLAVSRQWMKWRGADLPELAAWSKGRAVLVGDAAHATLPYLAQGAAMALEDACTLAACIGEESTEAAFMTFAARRRQRTSRIQGESRKLGGIYHARGIMALARDTALSLSGKNQALRRSAWIYSWQAGVVPA